MNVILGLVPSSRTFVLYCVIGAAGVVCDFFVYLLLLGFGGMGYQWANAGGYFIGTVLSFVLNARYNFRVGNRLVGRFLMFGGVALSGYVVSVVGLHLLVEWFGFDRYLAKVSAIVGIVLIQYNLNRRFSFRSMT